MSFSLTASTSGKTLQNKSDRVDIESRDHGVVACQEKGAISYNHSGGLGGAAASLPDDTLEICELWRAKSCDRIPTFRALPAITCILSDRIGALGDVVEGISIL